MNEQNEPKSLGRLIANLESDPDLQAAIQAERSAHGLTIEDRSIAPLKERVFQMVQEAMTCYEDQQADDVIIPVIFKRTLDDQIARAAHSKNTSPDEEVYFAPLLRLNLMLRAESNGRFVSLTVRDQNQRFVTQLNGARICSPTGDLLGTIQGWQARLLICDILGGIKLFALNGERITLKFPE